MSLATRTLATATAAALVSLAAGAAAGASGPGRLDLAASRCTALNPRLLDISLKPSGTMRFTSTDDGVATCDEVVQVRSYASGGPAVDNHHDPMIDEELFHVSELEAAGPAGVTVHLDLDACWSGVEVHRDGDTLLHSSVTGDGCEMTVATDFVGATHDVDLHVVQMTGSIQPPHIWSVETDDVNVLSGLPSGTWYVKVYDGWTFGSTIEVGGNGAVAQSTVYDVADGASVEVSIWPEPVVAGFSATNSITVR